MSAYPGRKCRIVSTSEGRFCNKLMLMPASVFGATTGLSHHFSPSSAASAVRSASEMVGAVLARWLSSQPGCGSVTTSSATSNVPGYCDRIAPGWRGSPPLQMQGWELRPPEQRCSARTNPAPRGWTLRHVHLYIALSQTTSLRCGPAAQWMRLRANEPTTALDAALTLDETYLPIP